jgi:hypothetical protein
MYVSTLQEVVKAMGGMLEIRAVFPDSAVVITQFEEIPGVKGNTDPERQPMGTEGSNIG